MDGARTELPAPCAWPDPSLAPKDGTLVLLMVTPDVECWTPFEDSLDAQPTFGFNNLEHTGEDRWQFAGWNWSQDVIVEGAGTVVGWRPLMALQGYGAELDEKALATAVDAYHEFGTVREAVETYLRRASLLHGAHPDDLAVDRYAAAMKAKLAAKRAEGRGGWDDRDACPAERLTALLRDHVEKGDPLDVGNLAMMIHQRGETIGSNDTLQKAYTLAQDVLAMSFATDAGQHLKRSARQLLNIADLSSGPDKVLIRTNGTARFVPLDEPVFLIRAQDSVSGNAVRAWADLAETEGAAPDIVEGARSHAAAMDAWSVKKIPDLHLDPWDRGPERAA